MYKPFKCLCLIAIVLLAACSEKNQIDDAVTSEESMSGLNAKIDLAHQAIEELKQASEKNNGSSSDQFASLTLDLKDPVALKTEFGPLLVKINKIYAAGDAAKIQLAIGNPYAVAFKGASFGITYGSLDANSNIIQSSQKSRNVSMSKTISPAATTVMTLDINDMRQKDLHYLIIDNFKFSSIGMR